MRVDPLGLRELRGSLDEFRSDIDASSRLNR
jgi:hypothetical protein